MIITIDGPSGTGKSTLAKMLAAKMQFFYLDTGAMYRSITYYLMKHKIPFDDCKKVAKALDSFEFDMKLVNEQQGDAFYVNGEDVSRVIRTQEVTLNVSEVSALKEIRTYMVSLQRKLAKSHDAVVEGRDMATVVFPNAEKKFFLTANAKTRAKRRLLQQNDQNLSLEDIQKDLERRDQYDSSREISPLMKAEGAIEINTSNMNIDEVLQQLISIIEK
jgi:CMP/dCMP kinase